MAHRNGPGCPTPRTRRRQAAGAWDMAVIVCTAASGRVGNGFGRRARGAVPAAAFLPGAAVSCWIRASRHRWKPSKPWPKRSPAQPVKQVLDAHRLSWPGCAKGRPLSVRPGRASAAGVSSPCSWPRCGPASAPAAWPEALGRYVAYASQLAVAAQQAGQCGDLSGLADRREWRWWSLFLLGYVVPRFAHIYEDLGRQPAVHGSHACCCTGVSLVEQLLACACCWVCCWHVPLCPGLGRWRPAFACSLPCSGCHGVSPRVGERVRVFQLARMYRTLGMLLRGGIAIVPALDMVSRPAVGGTAGRICCAATVWQCAKGGNRYPRRIRRRTG